MFLKLTLGEHELRSYSDEDEHLDDSKASPAKKSKKKRSLRIVESSESSDDNTKEDKEPKTIVPKIVLSKKLDTGDPEISCKPMNITVFSATALSSTKMDISQNEKTNISQSSDQVDNDEEVLPENVLSSISPKKKLLERSRKDSEGQKIKETKF